MHRKLIKQGGTGLTLYIPKKWLDKHQLQAGDDLDIEELDEKLLLSTPNQKREPSLINLTIPKIRESVTRTLITNAYRAGYDQLLVTYHGSQDNLNHLVSVHLIGFEVFKKKENLFSIESVAEPSYENFENIIEKQLFMILEILRTLETADSSELIHKVQRYDNFLKRCISKNIFQTRATQFLWQFLSNIAHIAKQSYHFNKILQSSKYSKISKNKLNIEDKINIKNKFDIKDKLNTQEKQFFLDIIDMYDILQKAYLSKKIEPLFSLHELDQKILQDKGIKLLHTQNPIHMHYLITIGRLIYLANTPLEGYLQEYSHNTPTQ